MKLLLRIQAFSRLQHTERWLFLKGMGIVMLIVFLTNLFPLRSFIRFLAAKPKNMPPGDRKMQPVYLVRKTLKRIEKYAPFTLSCFVKAATFKLLLNSLGVASKIELGIGKTSPCLIKAHACLTVNEKIVYLNKKGYAPVHTIG